MQEELIENKDPENQICRQVLEKLKVPLEPASLYCLQLAEWAAKSGKLELPEGTEENLDALLYLWDQKEAWDLLTEKGEDVVLMKPNDPDPLNLAWEVLELLQDKSNALIK